MSRIDDALRRVQSPAAATEPDAATAPFLPAWKVTDGAATGAEEPAAELPMLSGDGGLEISSAWRDRLATGPGGDPQLVEQFRRLAATLHQAHRTQGLRSVMVTSAEPGDGKTMTSINLALVLAESYRYRVLLIDADLRRPSISSVVELAEGSGLSEALRSSTPQKLALAQLGPRLTLLPAGRPTLNSIEALVSPRMRQILEEASTKFDWVIMDAPPIGPTADARLLSQMAGGTLFVIRADKSQYPEVERAVDMIGRDQILGVVLNDVSGKPTSDYYYYQPDAGSSR